MTGLLAWAMLGRQSAMGATSLSQSPVQVFTEVVPYLRNHSLPSRGRRVRLAFVRIIFMLGTKPLDCK